MPHEGRQRAFGRTVWIGKPCRIGVWENSSRGNRWTNRLAILIVVLLALGPVMFLEGPAEVARWHQAAAMERWLAGDKTGSVGTAGRRASLGAGAGGCLRLPG